jgi:hypothetical protein
VGPDLGRDLASETFTRAFAARKRYDALRGEERLNPLRGAATSALSIALAVIFVSEWFMKWRNSRFAKPSK